MLLKAEFLAIALVLVYVGAVMVLFLFVVMMLDINLDQLREGFWSYLPIARGRRRADRCSRWRWCCGAASLGRTRRRRPPPARASATPRSSASLFYTEYLYPLRDRRGDPAGGDRRGDRADAAPAQGHASTIDPADAGAACERSDRLRIVKMQRRTERDARDRAEPPPPRPQPSRRGGTA